MSQSFFDLPAELMTAMGTILGFALMGDLSINQQNSLGNLLELVGQVLLASAAQRQVLASGGSSARLEQLESQVARLQSRLEQLEKDPPGQGRADR